MASYKQCLIRLGLENVSLKPKQTEILDRIQKGDKQVLGILPTGYGKSLIFHMLPFLLNGVVLAFFPLSAIINEQYEKLKTTSAGLKSCILDTRGRIKTGFEMNESEVPDMHSNVPLEDIHKCDLIFCHPEALFSTDEGKQLLDSDSFRQRVKAVVVDECHKVLDWGESFRKAFACIKEIPAFFPSIQRLGLSATITVDQEKEIIYSLGFDACKIVRENPDRSNIFLEKVIKPSSQDIYETYEGIYKPLCDELLEIGSNFPVTLLYMPIQFIGNANAYCNYIFKGSTLNNCLYGSICSGQDDGVKNTILSELGKTCSRIRLVFCTSVIGMGFNSPAISRVIHSKPPHSLPDYVQEFGRAGRNGQSSKAILYYCKKDIASNIKEMKKDMVEYCNEEKCLRTNLLRKFGFDNSMQGLHKCCSYCKNTCVCLECQLFNIEL